jgi:hypothetical protein
LTSFNLVRTFYYTCVSIIASDRLVQLTGNPQTQSQILQGAGTSQQSIYMPAPIRARPVKTEPYVHQLDGQVSMNLLPPPTKTLEYGRKKPEKVKGLCIFGIKIITFYRLK